MNLLTIIFLILSSISIIDSKLSTSVGQQSFVSNSFGKIIHRIIDVVRKSHPCPMSTIVLQGNHLQNVKTFSMQLEYFPALILNRKGNGSLELLSEMFPDYLVLNGKMKIPEIIFWFIGNDEKIFWVQLKEFRETFLGNPRSPFILIITSNDKNEIKAFKEKCHKIWFEYNILNVILIVLPNYENQIIDSTSVVSDVKAWFFNQFINNGTFIDLSKLLKGNKYKNMFVDKLHDIYGHKIKVSKSRNIFGLKSGYEKSTHNFIKMFIKYINGTMAIIDPELQASESDATLIEEEKLDSKTRMPDIFGDAIFKHPNNIFKTSISCDAPCLKFLVPKSLRVPQYMNVILPFTKTTWVAIFCTLPMITVLLKLFRQDMSLETKTTLETLRIILSGATFLSVVSLPHKCFIGSCLLLTLVLMSAYQGSLTSYLTTPHYYPDIDNMEQLYESGLMISIPNYDGQKDIIDVLLVNTDPGDKVFNVLLKRAMFASDVKSVLDMIAFNRTLAYADADQILVLFIELNDYYEEGYPLMHIMEECSYKLYICLQFPFVSPYQDSLDTVMRRGYEGGIINKWQSDDRYEVMLSARNRIKPVELTPLELSHVQTSFYILLGGLTLSSLSLILELIFDIPALCRHSNTI